MQFYWLINSVNRVWRLTFLLNHLSVELYTGKLDKSVSRLFNFGLRRPKPFNTFFQYYYLKSLDKSVLSISRSTMHDRLIEFPCVLLVSKSLPPTSEYG